MDALYPQESGPIDSQSTRPLLAKEIVSEVLYLATETYGSYVLLHLSSKFEHGEPTKTGRQETVDICCNTVLKMRHIALLDAQYNIPFCAYLGCGPVPAIFI